MSRLSVGVIFGGRSVEHDVSIVTAHQVMAALADRHEVVPIYITRDGRWLSSPALNDLAVYKNERWDDLGDEAFIPPSTGYGGLFIPGRGLKRGRRVPLDVAVPSIHGTHGEDGTLQGVLELAGIPYTGSGVTGSAMGMDKVAMKAAFRAVGLPVVPHELVDAGDLDADDRAVVDRLERAVGYPAFVKPAQAGSSVGIGRARSAGELLDALEVARRYDRRILIEPSMEGCIEINCSVLGGGTRPSKASVCEQPVAWEEFLTFSNKYLRGDKPKGMASQERRIPAPISDALTKQVQDNAVRAFDAINASGVARIDSFVNEDTGDTWVMEINTTPGSFSFYLWEPSGVRFDELVQTLIDIALEEHDKKSELMFSFDSGLLERPRGVKLGD